LLEKGKKWGRERKGSDDGDAHFKPGTRRWGMGRRGGTMWQVRAERGCSALTSGRRPDQQWLEAGGCRRSVRRGHAAWPEQNRGEVGADRWFPATILGFKSEPGQMDQIDLNFKFN
jgi:hypothetical protein